MIPGVDNLAVQGSCAYTDEGNRYCPDIYGTYWRRGYRKKGFVIDCKNYESGRSINRDDQKKLDRDCNELEKKLREERKIKGDAEVVKIFVTTLGNVDNAESNGYTVISVGKPGAPHWKTKLKEGFEEAMK